MYELEHGQCHLSESEWPKFLYETGTLPDLDDDLHGLFHGYLLPIVGFEILPFTTY